MRRHYSEDDFKRLTPGNIEQFNLMRNENVSAAYKYLDSVIAYSKKSFNERKRREARTNQLSNLKYLE